ncbi:hypothetical protein L195_g048988, partial [Trifolium pratense]
RYPSLILVSQPLSGLNCFMEPSIEGDSDSQKDLALLMAGYIQFPDVPAVQLFSIWQGTPILLFPDSLILKILLPVLVCSNSAAKIWSDLREIFQQKNCPFFQLKDKLTEPIPWFAYFEPIFQKAERHLGRTSVLRKFVSIPALAASLKSL